MQKIHRIYNIKHNINILTILDYQFFFHFMRLDFLKFTYDIIEK